MTSKQQIIAFIGLALIGLTIWQHWRSEISVILFDAVPPVDVTKQDSAGNYPHVNQQGQLDPNGHYHWQPPTPGVGNPGFPTLVPDV